MIGFVLWFVCLGCAGFLVVWCTWKMEGACVVRFVGFNVVGFMFWCFNAVFCGFAF